MKKGFTLIELLAVIVILAVISLIAVPRIMEAIDSARRGAYNQNEYMMIKAAENYIVGKTDLIPTTENNVVVLTLEDLVQAEKLQAPNMSGENCTGYVVIFLKGTTISYDPNISCGVEYISDGFYSNHDIVADVLIVAGGGGGGYRHGAGGGAGGLIFDTNYSLNYKTSFNIEVGAGGLGSNSSSVRASSGHNSSFETFVAIGGGAGGQWDTHRNGLDGGSGGGSTTLHISSGILGQGNSGSQSATTASPYNHGGGGGAGSPGIDATLESHGHGGEGLYYGDVFGTDVGENGWFAGGGGGGGHNPEAINQGLGGLGGGGNGGTPGVLTSGEAGLSNTGGGGGGAATPSGGNGIGGTGGSGIVIIKYEGHPKATGGYIAYEDGYTIHAFKNVGNATLELINF